MQNIHNRFIIRVCCLPLLNEFTRYGPHTGTWEDISVKHTQLQLAICLFQLLNHLMDKTEVTLTVTDEGIKILWRTCIYKGRRHHIHGLGNNIFARRQTGEYRLFTFIPLCYFHDGRGICDHMGSDAWQRVPCFIPEPSWPLLQVTHRLALPVSCQSSLWIWYQFP